MSKEQRDAATRIIEGSGNNFHCKVAKFFADADWRVQISPYYVDPSTDKTREIDLIAERLYPTTDTWGRIDGYIRLRLHVECKYIAQGTVFWFGDQDVAAARSWVARRTPFKEDNVYINEHHYLKGVKHVAKLFATERSGGNVENEPIFKALNQTLNALLNSRGFISERKHVKCKATVEYPVIVCSAFDQFARTPINGDGSVSRIDDNFLLEVNYAYLTRETARPFSEYFLIDVVEYHRLPEFLSLLENEVSGFVEMLKD